MALFCTTELIPIPASSMWRSGDKAEGPSKMVPGPKMMSFKMKRKRDSRGQGEGRLESIGELYTKGFWNIRFVCFDLWWLVDFSCSTRHTDMWTFTMLIHHSLYCRSFYDAAFLCAYPRICRSIAYLKFYYGNKTTKNYSPMHRSWYSHRHVFNHIFPKEFLR